MILFIDLNGNIKLPLSNYSICKIGGSLLRGGDDYLRMASMLGGCVVVVSAMRGMTDRLIDAANQMDGKALNDILTSYVDALRLVSQKRSGMHFSDLNLVGNSAKLHLAAGDVDAVAAHGELLSVIIMAAALESHGVRAKAIFDPGIIVEGSQQGPRISGLSGFYVRQRLLSLISDGIVPVVPGFIGWSIDGKPATIGRGGSDFTASLLANYLGASRVIFYTDVPGIFSGDPKIIDNPKVIDAMNVEEAYVFSLMGGKKFHPKTFEPLIGTKITAMIKSPGEDGGTVISRGAGAGPKAIALFDASKIGRTGYAVAVIGKMDPKDLPFEPDFRDRGYNTFGKLLDDEKEAMREAKELHDWVISWAK